MTMISLTKDQRMLGFKVMEPYSNISCFTTTRNGGFSQGNYSSNNCGIHTNDNPMHVKQNLELICQSLPVRPTELVIPHQIHDTHSLVINQQYINASESERKNMLDGIDSLITSEKGYCLCVTTADCIPLTFYDKENQVIGTAHAGWRGTVKRIAQQTLERMASLYGTKGDNVIACMGPGISLAAFEVDEEVNQAFLQAGFPMDIISEWRPHTHKYHINLWLANRLQLTEFGIPDSQIEMAGICTYLRYKEFFSARRLGNESGRALTGIMINP